MSILTKLAFGTVDSVPFAPRGKLGVLDVVKAVASPAATLLGGLGTAAINAGAQSKANAQNIALQRETNAQNYKMFQEQMAFNENMWNKQNEYNLPVNQVARLKAAGINPSAVFGSGSVSEAGSLTSPSAPMMSAARVNPFQMDNNIVGQAVDAYNSSMLANASARKMNAETKNTEQQTLFDVQSMASKLRSLEAVAKRDDALGEMARLELSYAQDSYYHRLKSLRTDITLQQDNHEMNQEKIYNQKLLNGLAEVQLAYAPKLSEAQLNQYYATANQIKASISLINANKMLTDEQRLHEIEKKTGTIIDNGLKGFDFNIKSEVKNYVVRQAEAETKMVEFEQRNQKSGERFRRFTSVIPFASGYNSSASKKMFGVP